MGKVMILWSLIERKILAFCHLRCGPSILFFFGFFLPLLDGVKLFVKFCCFIFIFYFFFCFYYFILFYGFFPLVFLFVLIFLLLFCFLLFFIYFLSCFVYFACLRFVFFFCCVKFVCHFFVFFFCFCIILFFLLLKIYFVHSFCFCLIFFFSGFIFCFLFYFVILFDSFRLPFDFIECESELVCGFFVEFSGIFFVVFNLFETQHLLFVCFIFLIFIFGGLYFCFKFFFVFMFWFILPTCCFLPFSF